MVSVGKSMTAWWFESNIKFDVTADYAVWRMGFITASIVSSICLINLILAMFYDLETANQLTPVYYITMIYAFVLNREAYFRL